MIYKLYGHSSSFHLTLIWTHIILTTPNYVYMCWGTMETVALNNFLSFCDLTDKCVYIYICVCCLLWRHFNLQKNFSDLSISRSFSCWNAGQQTDWRTRISELRHCSRPRMYSYDLSWQSYVYSGCIIEQFSSASAFSARRTIRKLSSRLYRLCKYYYK